MTPPDPLFHDDAGNPVDPATPEAWAGWVSASGTRGRLKDDPLQDWLDRFGTAKGFVRDTAQPGWDPRTDFTTFIFEMGSRFEAAVMRLIAERLPVTTVSVARGDARNPDKARETVAAMRRGDPVIAQAVLRNPETRTYGVADLLVRSDHLNELVPGTIGAHEAVHPAPLLGDAPWHYRVVDIKFKALDIDRGGTASVGSLLAESAQVWLYNEALGRLQGHTPHAGYLLGRHARGPVKDRQCFARLARVERHAKGDAAGTTTLAERVADAIAWVRRLSAEGAGWDVLPQPSVPELYPDMGNDGDGPWHTARAAIAAEIAELTLLPATGPRQRRAAHAQGILRWDDPRVSSAVLGTTDQFATRLDAMLAANRDAEPVVHPERLEVADASWRTPSALELYVDFETITGVADDFARMPFAGGSPLIFQVGAGWWEPGGADAPSAADAPGSADAPGGAPGRWVFRQWTASRLTEAAEAEVIDGFLACLRELVEARGLASVARGGPIDPAAVRLIHWASHEQDTYESGPASARARHPERAWPRLPWFDALERVIQPGNVVIKGQWGFGLKTVAKAMHAAGLIETTWDEGPGDGMGAMVGAIRCDVEAARTGGSMRTDQLMIDIGKYNEVDCRAMAEIIRWLRANR